MVDDVPTSPAGRPACVAAAAGLFAGAAATAACGVDGHGRPGGAFTGAVSTVYGPGQAALCGLLLAAAVVLWLVRRQAAAAGALVVVGVCAAQLAGTGLVAIRRWPLFRGAVGLVPARDELVTERLMALGMAVTCGVAAVCCLVALVRGGHLAARGRASTVALVTALTLALVGPLLLPGRPVEVRELAAWSLMYGLPYAAALALAGFVRLRTAAVAVVAVAGCALVANAGTSYLELLQPWGDARVLVLAAAATTAAGRLLVSRPVAPPRG